MQSDNTFNFQNAKMDDRFVIYKKGSESKTQLMKYKDFIEQEKKEKKEKKQMKQDNNCQTKKQQGPKNRYWTSERDVKYYYVNQQLSYFENKAIINKFWNQIDKYAFLCQFNDFSSIKFLTDCGLLITDEIESEFKYRMWLWKYAQKSLDKIRRKSNTLARIIAQTLFENVF